MSNSDEPIRKGDLYSNRMGHRVPADCDGLLVKFGAEVRLIPAVRLAGVLGELGWKVKKRSGEPTGNSGELGAAND